MSGNINITDLENTFPYWISNHLGERSYMDTAVTQYPTSPRDDSSRNEGSPSIDTRPPPERETNIMTQGKLDRLWESCSFPARIQIRLPEVDETIMSTCPSEEAFYEATFQAGMRLPIHPTLKRILAYYNTFALDSGKMVSNVGDNVEKKSASNEAHVAADEDESCLSRAMSKNMDMKKLAQLAKAKGEPKRTPREGTSSIPRVVLGLEASTMDNLGVAEKLLQGVILPVDKKTVSRLDLDMATTRFLLFLIQVITSIQIMLRAKEVLRRLKEEHDVSLKRHEKDMAEIRRKDALAKTSVIDEFKSLDEYMKVVEGAASSYFGEGFDLCKKQIGILHPNLDIQDLQIDPDLVDEDEEK
ncbi:hypothetical protein Acr_14g0006610 [Actinidia rufa]|uniref:Uncharacterized protein n=1 Tax=Actinidia rufa TaxID=165716 RepID=A0A7J0FQN3_9ERIC|nr:hypothetical protein Acr_14g0006610 [Actinidia rufa]